MLCTIESYTVTELEIEEIEEIELTPLDATEYRACDDEETKRQTKRQREDRCREKTERQRQIALSHAGTQRLSQMPPRPLGTAQDRTKCGHL